jgi:hypothetical protein
MALQIERTTVFGDNIKSDYHRIEGLTLIKEKDGSLFTAIAIVSYASEDAAKVENAMSLGINNYRAEGSMDIEAAYSYLKTLEEWKDSTDC